MGKKKGEKDKRSKSLRDKTSRLSDWKKKQRSNVKKFVQQDGGDGRMSESKGKSKKNRQLAGDMRPKPHTKKEMKEKRLKKKIKETETWKQT